MWSMFIHVADKRCLSHAITMLYFTMRLCPSSAASPTPSTSLLKHTAGAVGPLRAAPGVRALAVISARPSSRRRAESRLARRATLGRPPQAAATCGACSLRPASAAGAVALHQVAKPAPHSRPATAAATATRAPARCAAPGQLQHAAPRRHAPARRVAQPLRPMPLHLLLLRLPASSAASFYTPASSSHTPASASSSSASSSSCNACSSSFASAQVEHVCEAAAAQPQVHEDEAGGLLHRELGVQHLHVDHAAEEQGWEGGGKEQGQGRGNLLMIAGQGEIRWGREQEQGARWMQKRREQ